MAEDEQELQARVKRLNAAADAARRSLEDAIWAALEAELASLDAAHEMLTARSAPAKERKYVWAKAMRLRERQRQGLKVGFLATQIIDGT